MRIEARFSAPPAYAPLTAKKAEATAESIPSCGENLIESMIRVAPSDESRHAIAAALSNMPLEAVARVAQYGTRIEVYDGTQADLPLYAKHLQKPNLSGAYSPTANVIFFEKSKITPLVLLHEFSHALDRALGDVSQSEEWQKARDKSLETRVCIRPYATRNSAEYFADNMAAHLIPDESLPKLMGRDWNMGINTEGLTKEYFVKNHANYSHGRQQKADPTAFAMLSALLAKMPEMPAASPRPALTPEEYRAVKIAELRELKAREAGQQV